MDQDQERPQRLWPGALTVWWGLWSICWTFACVCDLERPLWLLSVENGRHHLQVIFEADVCLSPCPPHKFQWMCKNYIKMMFSVSLICQSLKEGVWTRESYPLSQPQSLTVCSMKCFLHTELENGMGMKRNAHHSDLAGVNSVAIYA